MSLSSRSHSYTVDALCRAFAELLQSFCRASYRALVELRVRLRAQLTPELVREGPREGPYKALGLDANVELATLSGPQQQVAEACKVDIWHK